MLAYKVETADGDRWFEWHLGEAIPDLGRVARLQATGHELQMLYAAMAVAHIGPGGRVVVQDTDLEA